MTTPYHAVRAQGYKDWGEEECGKIFCEHVDKVILQGYNPDLVFELSSNLTTGNKVCVQKYISK